MVFLFMKSSIHTIYIYSDFFLVYKLCKSDLQIVFFLYFFILDVWAMLILETLSHGVLRRVTYFEHRLFYLRAFWYLLFEFHRVHKNLKSSHNILFPVIFTDHKIIRFWFVNYVCQVCKLYFLFWTCPEFRTIFIFGCFKWIVKVTYLQLLVNIRCSHFTWNFFLLFGGKNPFFLMKNFSNFLILLYFFVQRSVQFYHNLGTIGCWKLPYTTLNRIFNALPIRT